MTATGPLEPSRAKALVHAGGEIAFLDVREHGQYGEGHPFLAVPCPFSRLESLVPDLVPRRGVPVLLVDGGDGVAEQAAIALAGMGYRFVAWVAGGAPAWTTAGFTLFKGVNLPSKTLGELLEECWHIPRISGDDLVAWRGQGRAFRLFDGRPATEYRKMTIPGAASMPNGELAHRFEAAVPDRKTPVVVHCAGRTRSIVGAAGLMLAGIANPVFALEDGTQGWALSGRSLDHGRKAEPLPELGPEQLKSSADRAQAIIERHRLRRIDPDELGRLTADATRTVYVLDVRSAAEFEDGTVPGATHAPAVQLLQATDQWIGVRRATVVLVDDTGLRAAIAAVFLRTLNYDAVVLASFDPKAARRFARAEKPSAPQLPALPRIAAGEALEAARSDAALLDLRSSTDYRSGHLDGACWTIRPRLAQLRLDPGQPVLLCGPPTEVGLAAKDLSAAGFGDIRHVAGDARGWREAGLPVVATPGVPSDEQAIDYLFFVHDRHDGNLEAARRYLAWEKGLTAQLDADERAEYRITEAPFPGPLP